MASPSDQNSHRHWCRGKYNTKELAPQECIFEADEPLCFLTANEGRILERIYASPPTSSFNNRWEAIFFAEPMSKGYIIYEADIKLVAIISYTWLRKNKVGIFPHQNALRWIRLFLRCIYPKWKGTVSNGEKITSFRMTPQPRNIMAQEGHLANDSYI